MNLHFERAMYWDKDSIDELINKYSLQGLTPEMVVNIMRDIENYGGFDDIVDPAYLEIEEYTAKICMERIRLDNHLKKDNKND